ncbi:hypothetical protein PIB30_097896 [Stylosanthes scabra]|uniref:R13L1/DRL21-like LRR repeat region domain-containing protein n=1 Tax=Stylosanthes scabra TaxID=79078 RepID=A0ABU6ZVJ8_9FABA|nr:hypothetical protein [Stylosanthes scabra]
MHDLVHDLAKSVAEQECMCLDKANLSNLPRNSHHIDFEVGGQTETQLEKGTLEKFESLRTLYQLKWDGGQLRIQGLENVVSVCEAQDANFKGKEDVQELRLLWENFGETKSVVAEEEVLEALQPHSNLKRLEIVGCGGINFPTWIGNTSALNSLVYLLLQRCKNSRQLPSLGRLPSLRKLEIWSMDDVRYIDEEESYNGIVAKPFPSLEELKVFSLPNLEQLLRRKTTGINELLRSICNLNCLNQLHLRGSKVSYFPEGMMNNMTSLAYLRISFFSELKELPSDITKLSALSDLSVDNCDKLECLPEQGLEGLSSLRHLIIRCCEGLGSLPEGVGQLTSLQSLTIEFCPALIKRCVEGTGEDWHKIAHIPKVILKGSD